MLYASESSGEHDQQRETALNAELSTEYTEGKKGKASGVARDSVPSVEQTVKIQDILALNNLGTYCCQLKSI